MTDIRNYDKLNLIYLRETAGEDMALLQIIEWMGAPDTIVYKYPTRENAIERGSRLVVREGQAAIFCDRGKLADVFGTGT